MKPSTCVIEDDIYRMLTVELLRRGTVSICEDCNVFSCEHSVKGKTEIAIGYARYTLIKSDAHLPKNAEWCKTCQKTSAVPIALINFNNKQGYVLECPHCKGRYPVYKSAYTRKHSGSVNTLGRYIPPTQNRVTPTYMQEQATKRIYERSIQCLMTTYGYTREEAVHKKAIWDEEDRKSSEKFAKEEKRKSENWQLERREEESARRVEKKTTAIKSGKVVWDKNAKCLINIETGEVVPL